VLFKGDLETGDLSRFSRIVGGVQILTENPIEGVYYASCLTAGTGSETVPDRTYVEKVVSPIRKLYAQVLVRLNQDLKYDTQRFSIISMVDGGGAVGSCGVEKVDGVLRWYLAKAEKIHAFSGPAVGQVHRVELFQDTETEGLILYVDNVQVLNLVNVYPQNITGVRFGATYANMPYPISVDIDNCIIADQYIGPTVPKVLVYYESTPLLVNATIDGVTVPSGSSLQIDAGTAITISTPQTIEHYYFNHWLINGQEQKANPLTIENVATDLSVIAVYAVTPIEEFPWGPITALTSLVCLVAALATS